MKKWKGGQFFSFGVGPRGEFDRGEVVCSTDESRVPPSERDPVLDKRPADSAKDTRGDEENPLVSREFERENEALMLWWTRFPVLIAIGFVDVDCAGGKTNIEGYSSLS